MKKSLGYTLIELMSMLAVVTILVSVGLPMLNVFFDSNRMVSNTNDLVAGLNIAYLFMPLVHHLFFSTDSGTWLDPDAYHPVSECRHCFVYRLGSMGRWLDRVSGS